MTAVRTMTTLGTKCIPFAPTVLYPVNVQLYIKRLFFLLHRVFSAIINGTPALPRLATIGRHFVCNGHIHLAFQYSVSIFHR